MAQHYNAFISYRHAPADIAVASEIQKRLERYHVPGAIQKKTGKKKIERIFRDKEELPITSDLNKDIAAALENADFLIVICSTATKESYWVPREISYFLQNHTKNQILTVLVDGEPKDVIPEILLSDTVTRTAPDGTTYSETVHYEPLSCDFRSGIRAARKSEIPRLAAALLGCSYNELVMRERQYARKRAAAILTPVLLAAAIAITYLTWSRQEIRKNLDQSLINQSVFLSSESERLQEDGDRLRAIELAMRALPSPEDPRPLTPQAQNALCKALSAYSPPETQDYRYAMSAVAEFVTQGNIEESFSSDEGTYIFARDSYHIAYVWSADGSRVLTLSSAETDVAGTGSEDDTYAATLGEVQDILLLENDTLAVRSTGGIQVYSLKTGKELWHHTDDAVRWYSSHMETNRERSQLFLAMIDDEGENCSGLVLNAADGEKQWESVPWQLEEKALAVVTDIFPSPGGTRFAFTVQNYSSDTHHVLVCSAADESILLRDPAEEIPYIQDIRFLNEDDLAVMWYPEYSSDHEGGNTFLGMTTLQNFTIHITRLSSVDGTASWTAQFSSPQSNALIRHKGLGMPDQVEGKIEHPVLTATYANKTVLIDPDTGKILDEFESSAQILHSYHSLDGYIYLYLANGHEGLYDPAIPGESSELTYVNFSVMDMNYYWDGEMAAFLLQPNDHTLWIYDLVYDEDFTRFSVDPLPASMSIKASDIVGNTLMFLDYDDSLYLLPLDQEGPLTRLSLAEKYGEESTHFYWVGGDRKKGYGWVYRTADGLLLRISEDGEMTSYPLDDQYISGGPQLLNGNLYAERSQHLSRMILQEDGTLSEDHFCDQPEDMYKWFLSPDAEQVLFSFRPGSAEKEHQLLLLTPATGEETYISCKFRDTLRAVCWDQNHSRLALTDGREIQLISAAGETISQVQLAGHNIISMQFHEDQLLILWDEGILARYNTETGALTGRTEIAYYEGSQNYTDSMQWDFYEDILCLTCTEAGSNLLHFIDPVTFEETAYTQHAVLYDRDRDRVLSYGVDRAQNKDKYLGYFPRYTPEDLLRKGEEALQGARMSQEELAAYGLK